VGGLLADFFPGPAGGLFGGLLDFVGFWGGVLPVGGFLGDVLLGGNLLGGLLPKGGFLGGSDPIPLNGLLSFLDGGLEGLLGPDGVLGPVGGLVGGFPPDGGFRALSHLSGCWD